jgi:hypothetical protein
MWLNQLPERCDVLGDFDLFFLPRWCWGMNSSYCPFNSVTMLAYVTKLGDLTKVLHSMYISLLLQMGQPCRLSGHIVLHSRTGEEENFSETSFWNV